MKKFVIALSALGLLAGSAPSLAAKPCKDKQGKFVKGPAPPAQCRDKSGHFIKCPAPKAAAKAKLCRDAKGHYATCK